MVKKKAHKLEVTGDEEFEVIGISSSENDYRLCWALNNHLKINLTRTENYTLFNSKLNAEQFFGLFIYYDEDNYIKYQLLANKSETGWLLTEYKNIDFIIKIQGDLNEDLIENLVKDLKKIKEISAVFYLSPDNLKSRNRLIF